MFCIYHLFILNAKLEFLVTIDKDSAEIERPFEVSLPSKDSRVPAIKFKINLNVDKNGKVRTTGIKNKYIAKDTLSGNKD